MNALIRVRVRILSHRQLKCITQFTLLVTEPGFKPRAPELLHYLLGPSHGIPTPEKGTLNAVAAARDMVPGRNFTGAAFLQRRALPQEHHLH